MIIENVVMLSTVPEVQDFCNLMSKVQGEVTLHSGRYVVDGKSLMGLFSLDLSLPITVKFEIEGDIPLEVKEGVKQYLVRQIG